MVKKLSAMESLQFIRDRLIPELGLVPLDKPSRTHGQMFSIGSADGKQFLLIIGTEAQRPKQTRIITEKVVDPEISGARFSEEPAGSARVNQQKTSLGFENRIRNSNQSSFYVKDLDALAELIRWYSNTSSKSEGSGEIQQPTESDTPITASWPNDSGKIQDILDLLDQGAQDQTSREQLIQARLGQGKFREEVIRTWGLGKRCAVTGIEIPQLLIASHIIPWREAIELRVDGRNGILLCAHLDKLFDQYLISFNSMGQLLMSERLSISDREYLQQIGVNQSLSLNMEALENSAKISIKENLRKHQENMEDLDSA